MFGFFRFAAASPVINTADVEADFQEMSRLYAQAEQNQAALIFFPELSLTGASAQDLFFHDSLLESARDAMLRFARRCGNCVAVFGVPLVDGNRIYNLFAVAQAGKLVGFVPAKDPDLRCFSADLPPQKQLMGLPCARELLFHAGDATFAFEPELHPELLLHPAPGICLPGMAEFNRKYSEVTAAANVAALIVNSNCAGESTGEAVRSAHALIASPDHLAAEIPPLHQDSAVIYADIDLEAIRFRRRKQPRFRTENKEAIHIQLPAQLPEAPDFKFALLPPRPYLPQDDAMLPDFCRETLAIQTTALARRMQSCHAQKMVIGISGGLDSTLALILLRRCCGALDMPCANIVAVTMPGFGTTGRTKNNAVKLAEIIGADLREISIAESCRQHFADIGHDPELHNSVYENSQARERTQILMDIANAVNGIVIGTGDLSEMALGWCTYNGDQMSMYGINASIPKTMIAPLLQYEASVFPQAAAILQDVIATPVSPELLPPQNGEIGQKTESILGPYELHDFFIWHLLINGASRAKILALAKVVFRSIYPEPEIDRCAALFFKRFFQQQFKRSASPDSVQAGSISLSPRGGFMMPSDITGILWQK